MDLVHNRILVEILNDYQHNNCNKHLNSDFKYQFPFINIKEPIPFEDVFIPFILYARQKLSNQLLISTYDTLSPKAHMNLERNLLLKLSQICSQTLALKFSIYREMRHPGISRKIVAERKIGIEHDNANELYSCFVNDLLNGGLLDILKEYNVLAKLFAIIISQWINNTAELIKRLQSDYMLIQNYLNDGKLLGQVVVVQPNLSDPHQNGRTNVAISFSSGLKIIYKAKDLGLALAFQRLLFWINSSAFPLKLKECKIVNRNGYGWCEYIEYLPCENVAAVNRYYQRAGMLLCLVYILNGTDCHFENIIANGEYPVLIDHETLAQPYKKIIGNPGMNIRGQAMVDNYHYFLSVMSTGMLPNNDQNSDKQQYDISGLGGSGGEGNGTMVLHWENINTDKMVLVSKPFIIPKFKNIPFQRNHSFLPVRFRKEIKEGFKQMYLLMMARKELLICPTGPLNNFYNQRVRYIHRPTRLYSKIQNILLHPKYLHSDANRNEYLEILNKSHKFNESSEMYRVIIEQEKRAFELLDIPIFYTNTNCKCLSIPDAKKNSNYFDEAGFDVVISKIKNLSEIDLARQVDLIGNSFSL